MLLVWQAKDNFRITVKSDAYQFFAIINAGATGETYLSVGYSSPNLAISQDDIDAHPNGLAIIQAALDDAWRECEQKPLEDMMPSLLHLAKTANNVYSKRLPAIFRLSKKK